MAILGNAYVKVQITGNPEQELKRKLNSMRTGDIGAKAGWDFNKGFSGMAGDGPFKKFTAEADAARLKLNSLIKTGYVMGPLFTAIAGSIGALGTALVSLVSVVGAATPALMALGNSLSALLQAGIAVKLAMRGVAEAIQIDDGGKGPDLSGPLDRVLEARIRLRNLINKEQPERLAAARERAVEAEGRAADALRNSEGALRTYNQAQERTYEALEDLNKARERARERIQQLRFETEGAAISEKQARLSFEKTRDALQRVQDLPPNSRARQEAELAFAQADLNLRKAIDSNADLKKEEEAATRAGVEGSDEVVNAKKAIEQATQAEADAQYEAARAYLAAAKAREEADKAAEDASAGGAVQQQIDADIARARKQLEDALKDLEKAKSGGGADALQKALEDLSPAAREFVLYMRDIKKEFKILGDSAATGFFPILTNAVELVRGRLVDLAPMFESTGVSAGTAALSIAEAFTEAQTFGNIQKIWKNNNTLIEIFGRAIGNLVRGISALLVAAGPLTEKFATWIETVTGDWATRLNNDIDGQTERFNRAGEIAARLGGILGGIGGIFLDLGRIIMAPGGAGESLLTFFEEGIVGVRAFLQAGGPDGDGSLVTQFRTATENGLKLLEIIGDIVVILFDLGSSDNLTTFLGSLDNAVGSFGAMGTAIDDSLPAFGTFLEQFSILLLNLTESGGINAFFSTLSWILGGVNAILENELIRSIFLFLAQIKGIGLAFGTAFSAASFVWKSTIGFFLAKAASAFMSLGVYLMNFGGIWRTIGIRMATFGNNITKFLKGPFKMLFSGLRILIGLIWKGLFGALKAILAPIIGITGPFLAIGIAIVALGIIIWKFRDQIWEFVQGIIEFFRNLWHTLVGNSIIPDMVNGIIEWVVSLWDRFTELVSNGITAVIDFFKELPGKVLDALVEFATKVLEFILEYHPLAIIWRLISENWDAIKAWFSELPGRIVETLSGLTTKVLNFIRDNHPILILLRFVKEKWPEVKEWLTSRIDGIADWFRDLPDKIRTQVRSMWDGLKDAFRDALNWIIDKWNNFRLELRLPDSIFGIPMGRFAGMGFTLETPNIPRLAMGGVVQPRSGGVLSIIGEAGRAERIEPLDSSGLSKRDRAMIQMLSGGGSTINVYPSAGMNEQELANLVSRRLAYEMRSGAA